LFIIVIIPLSAKMIDQFNLIKPIGRLVPAEFTGVHH
jgi:hypothetical protein